MSNNFYYERKWCETRSSNHAIASSLSINEFYYWFWVERHKCDYAFTYILPLYWLACLHWTLYFCIAVFETFHNNNWKLQLQLCTHKGLQRFRSTICVFFLFQFFFLLSFLLIFTKTNALHARAFHPSIHPSDVVISFPFNHIYFFWFPSIIRLWNIVYNFCSAYSIHVYQH